MTKTAKKVEENFLTSNVFIFSSFACECAIEEKYLNPGEEPKEYVKVIADKSRPINFAFGSKVGLVRLNEDGSIADSNILGKLLDIDNSSIQNYFDFFNRNGFLLPISKSKYDTIGITELKLIVDRLHATLELISTITDMSRTSYEKIIRMIFYHLFSPIVSVETMDSKYTYISSRHQYNKFVDEHKNAKRDERLNDTFNNAEFTFVDTFSGITLDADFVTAVLDGVLTDSIFENQLFKDVFTTYCMPRDEILKNMLIINDFIFHYLYKVGLVEHVDLEKTYYVGDFVNKENFTPAMKAKATEIAKFIIKEEIETTLRRVRPSYNISKLEPAWKIDSLLSALYFGLFYMRPNMETYRRCANPKCGEFFLVPVSSQKKKYCCTACMNREMAARKRARDKIKESKDK